MRLADDGVYGDPARIIVNAGNEDAISTEHGVFEGTDDIRVNQFEGKTCVRMRRRNWKRRLMKFSIRTPRFSERPRKMQERDEKAIMRGEIFRRCLWYRLKLSVATRGK